MSELDTTATDEKCIIASWIIIRNVGSEPKLLSTITTALGGTGGYQRVWAVPRSVKRLFAFDFSMDLVGNALSILKAAIRTGGSGKDGLTV